jgi:hypothetical protein
VSRFASLVVVLMLSGCGLPELPAVQQGPPPANDYRRIASQSGYVSALRARPELTNFEIAGLRPAVAPQPGEWMTCLRVTDTTGGGVQAVYFGVFIRQWTVIEVRRGIFIDRCEQEQYSALALYPALKAE